MRPYLKNTLCKKKKKKKTSGVAQAVQHLPSKHSKALSSSPSTAMGLMLQHQEAAQESVP
jgi:hypothetical protein